LVRVYIKKAREAQVPKKKKDGALSGANDNVQHGDEGKQEPQPKSSVGYGKPPKHSQFEKGKSGNPKGRPKGSQNLKTVLKAAFDQKVSLVRNGKSIKMPVIQAMATKVVAMGLSGNHAAMKMAFELYAVAFPAGNDNQSVATGSSFELTPEEWAAIEKSSLLKGAK
jgi:hypothetical protein